MQRFFVNPQCIGLDSVVLKSDIMHQIRDVLRLQSGAHIAVLDNSGWEYDVALERIEKEQATGVVCGKREIAEPSVKITLYQALIKSDKFEFVLQKGAEIGIFVFVPVTCERCVARNPGAKKQERWEKVIAEAAEQSGRGKLPILMPAVSFRDACRAASGTSIIAGIGADSTKLSDVLRADKSTVINLFIGPEGGFTVDEEEFARSCGVCKVTLGPRTLRSETAGLAAAVAILYERGELDKSSIATPDEI
jgi:16S rRNA (uracil1498-N3)-methyltransferase